VLFAFYSACALSYATRSHLAVDAWAARQPPRLRSALEGCARAISYKASR
jgi:TRAP-type C4-dicarboxylate transport system permease small subunit